MQTSNRIYLVRNKNKREENGSQEHDKMVFKVDSSELKPPYVMTQGNKEKGESRIKKIIETDDIPRELRIKKTVGIPRLPRIKKAIEIDHQGTLSIQCKLPEQEEERN